MTIYHCQIIDFIIIEKTKQMLFQRVGASIEATVQSVVVDKIPCDRKPSKQMQLTFDGKLCKPNVLIEVGTYKNDFN